MFLLFFLLLPAASTASTNTNTSTATLLRLQFYRTGSSTSSTLDEATYEQPTSVLVTLAIFRARFLHPISVQSILPPNALHPLPFSTPKQIISSSSNNNNNIVSMQQRPGLAGMLSMTCNDIHTFDSYSSLTNADRCPSRPTNRNDWLQPPNGLLVLPMHDCSSSDGSESTNNFNTNTNTNITAAAATSNIPTPDLLSRAIKSALGIKTFNKDELVTAFILTWEDNRVRTSREGILEHAIVRGKNARNRQVWMDEVLEDLTETCVLSHVLPHRQTLFPPGKLTYKQESTNSLGSAVNNDQMAPLAHPIRRWIPSKRDHTRTFTFAIMDESIHDDVHRDIHNTNNHNHPSTDPLPPSPNYCPTTTKDKAGLGGKHKPHIETALRAYHESAFIEQNAKMLEFPIPFVDTILEFIMKLVLPALLNPFAEYYVKEVSGRVSDEMEHKIVADVPEDVVKLLTPPLTYNVSNLLTDSLTASVSKSLITSLTMEFGAPIVLQLVENLMKSLYNVLNPFLDVAVPEKLANVLPYLLERSLPITLTRRLTRSLTHALVPTLSRSLSSSTSSSHQKYWCDMCARKALHCNYCHDSPQSQYYTNFYANYYSDYCAFACCSLCLFFFF